MWAKTPDNSVLGEQILLISAAAWDTPKMVASSRKMFNLLKTPTWARVAAWAEWADVRIASYLVVPVDSFSRGTSHDVAARAGMMFL